MSVATESNVGVHITSINVKKNENGKGENNNGASPDPPQDNDSCRLIEKSVTVEVKVASGDIEQTHVDELAPAESLWTTHRDQAVKLRMKEKGPGSQTAISICTLLKHSVNNNPNGIAMAVKRNGDWVKWTYRQYLADIRRAAKAFIKLGLEPYKAVGIIGFNSPEWFLSELGCILAGGLATGIYTTNSSEACRHVAHSSQANIIVVENNQQLQKILQVREKLPHLKAIVQYTGQPEVTEDNIYSWQQFMEKGDDVPDDILDERIMAQSPNKCCILIYTSGTTGSPKGVMLSHDNITWTASLTKHLCLNELNMKHGDVCMVSYLPLSHIAAQMDIFTGMAIGGSVYFAQPDALKGSLGDTLREVRPHVLTGVPRVWEKMQERMQLAGRSVTGIKRRISTWAKGVGLKANYARMKGESLPFGYGLADMLLFKKVRNLLGLDRCVLRVTGAAPITKETLEFFMGVNLPLSEVYGMSESAGPHTFALPTMNKMCSVGKELNGMTTVLDNMDEEGNGEIVMHGRHVFMGYLDDEEKTRETLDEHGGLKSGDVGKKDHEGFMFITGRIKELLITAGGENVAPVPIEESVKTALPVVSQCMLIGDRRKFLSMLLSLKVDVNMDTLEPTDKLTDLALDWVKQQGSSATTVSEILNSGDKAVLQAIQNGINKVNKNAVSNAQKIQKWSLIPVDFSIPGGELGPTMKVRRPVVHKMYANTIDAFYADTPTASSTSSSPPSSPAADSGTPVDPSAVAPDLGAASAAGATPDPPTVS